MNPDYVDLLRALLAADVRFMVVGAPLMGLTEKELGEPGVGLQIGMEPLRIDILTKISGVTFAQAWPRHITAEFAEGVRCPVIGLEALLANKRASGRLQDLADVAAIEKLQDALAKKRQ